MDASNIEPLYMCRLSRCLNETIYGHATGEMPAFPSAGRRVPEQRRKDDSNSKTLRSARIRQFQLAHDVSVRREADRNAVSENRRQDVAISRAQRCHKKIDDAQYATDGHFHIRRRSGDGLRSWRETSRTAWRPWHVLRRRRPVVRETALSDVLASIEQLRAVYSKGHEIGCQTFSHVAVSSLSRGELERRVFAAISPRSSELTATCRCAISLIRTATFRFARGFIWKPCSIPAGPSTRGSMPASRISACSSRAPWTIGRSIGPRSPG